MSQENYEAVHAKIVGEVVAKLKTVPIINAATSGRIFASTAPEAAGTTVPKIVVSKSKLNPPPASQSGKVLIQANVRVEITAADHPTLDALCVAVQKAISAGPGISDKRPCVLIDTGRVDEGDHVSRRDVFGVFFPSDEQP